MPVHDPSKSSLAAAADAHNNETSAKNEENVASSHRTDVKVTLDTGTSPAPVGASASMVSPQDASGLGIAPPKEGAPAIVALAAPEIEQPTLVNQSGHASIEGDVAVRPSSSETSSQPLPDVQGAHVAPPAVQQLADPIESIPVIDNEITAQVEPYPPLEGGDVSRTDAARQEVVKQFLLVGDENVRVTIIDPSNASKPPPLASATVWRLYIEFHARANNALLSDEHPHAAITAIMQGASLPPLSFMDFISYIQCCGVSMMSGEICLACNRLSVPPHHKGVWDPACCKIEVRRRIRWFTNIQVLSRVLPPAYAQPQSPASAHAMIALQQQQQQQYQAALAAAQLAAAQQLQQGGIPGVSPSHPYAGLYGASGAGPGFGAPFASQLSPGLGPAYPQGPRGGSFAFGASSGYTAGASHPATPAVGAMPWATRESALSPPQGVRPPSVSLSGSRNYSLATAAVGAASARYDPNAAAAALSPGADASPRGGVAPQSSPVSGESSQHARGAGYIPSSVAISDDPSRTNSISGTISSPGPAQAYASAVHADASATSSQAMHTGCAMCGKPSLGKCPNCSSRVYCTRDCQVQDWPSHRLVCPGTLAIAAAVARSASSATPPSTPLDTTTIPKTSPKLPPATTSRSKSVESDDRDSEHDDTGESSAAASHQGWANSSVASPPFADTDAAAILADLGDSLFSGVEPIAQSALNSGVSTRRCCCCLIASDAAKVNSNESTCTHAIRLRWSRPLWTCW